MHVELVVFDLAGTTVQDDDVVAEHLQAALGEAAVPVTIEQVDAVMGWPKPDAIRELLRVAGQPEDEEDIARIHDRFVRNIVEHYRSSRDVREVAGTSGVFRWLAERGIKVAIDTGFSTPITKAVVDRMQWRDRGLLDVVVSSDEVAHGRPFPDMIFLAMQRAGVDDPSRVVKVGDTPSDLIEGRRAKCGFVVGVTRGSHTREQLERHAHDALIPTVASLPGTLLSVMRGPRRLDAPGRRVA